MTLYSRVPAKAVRQIIADATALTLIWLSVRLALFIRDKVLELVTIGEHVEAGGESGRESLVALGETLAGIPFIGDDLTQPFGKAAGAAASVADIGVDLQDTITDFADVVAWAIGIPSVLLVLVLWLIPRVRFVLSSYSTKQLLTSQAGRDLLALRALTTLNPTVVLRAVPNAAHAWRSGDRDAIDALSGLAARQVGLGARVSGSRKRSRASRTP